jgi:rubrerythrin
MKDSIDKEPAYMDSDTKSEPHPEEKKTEEKDPEVKKVEVEIEQIEEIEEVEEIEHEEVEPWLIDTTPWEDPDAEYICACGSKHMDDNYPEQCPTCNTWYVGQCASDYLFYDDATLEPYTCLVCNANNETTGVEEEREA